MRNRQAVQWVIGLASVVLLCDASPAATQAPLLLRDVLYRGTSARRAFFDGYALSGQIAYRPTRAAPKQEGAPVASIAPLGLAFRFDYQLASQLDVGAIIDASGGPAGRTLSVSWVVLKYYDYAQGTDVALRLAVDPASGGLVGFPQMDLALLTTSLLTPFVTNDLAIGVRRVRMGFERWVRPEEPSASPRTDGSMAGGAPDPSLEVVYNRVMGWELHLSTSYNYHFDPAGSYIFFTILAEGGQYDIYETARSGEGDGDPSAGEDGVQEEALVTTYQSGAVWLRSGIEFSRPSYQIHPFIGVPLLYWVSGDEENAVHARFNAGLRLTIR